MVILLIYPQGFFLIMNWVQMDAWIQFLENDLYQRVFYKIGSDGLCGFFATSILSEIFIFGNQDAMKIWGLLILIQQMILYAARIVSG